MLVAFYPGCMICLDFLTKLRLSCQLRPTGDVAIELPGLKVKLKP